MKKGICETRADCLRELARVMDMAQNSKLPWNQLLREDRFGVSFSWTNDNFPLFVLPGLWNFARAIVDNRPVFDGDELYDKNGVKFTVRCMPQLGDRIVLDMSPIGFCDDGIVRFADECSWERKPLCMVEGKPVYEGSKLYHKNGSEYIVQEVEQLLTRLLTRKAFRTVHAPWTNGDYIENYSWNPPKPKTVVFNGEELPMLGCADETSFHIKVSCKTQKDCKAWVDAIRRSIHGESK